MDVELECKLCPHRISTGIGLFTVCGGPCRKAFHITCISMKTETLNALSGNVIWFCDECLDLYRNWKEHTEPPADKVTREIAELKMQVAGILDVIDLIKPAQQSPSVVEVCHSTPVTSTKLMNGTNASCVSRNVKSHVCRAEINATERTFDQMHERENENNFSLFLTNVDSAVVEDDIRKMVFRCLGASITDYCYVKKLVSRFADHSTMDGVSFKVTLNANWKSLAMKASTWPLGIRFREFIDRRAQRWRPDE